MTKRTTRVYWRMRSYGMAAYADFRDYADVGAGQQALIAEGDDRPTSDPDVATRLVAQKLEELENARKLLANPQFLITTRLPQELAEYAKRHMELKGESGGYDEDWLEQVQMHLEAACDLLGARTLLPTITVAEISDKFLRGLDGWVARRNRRKGRQARPLGPGSRRKYLNSLSNLLGRAVSEGVIQFNAVALLKDKPKGKKGSPRWFEVDKAALILEAARQYQPNQLKQKQSLPYLYPVVAALLLTGGRLAEVLGLEVDDVNFYRETVRFQTNEWRTLKTEDSERTGRLWPQLAEILQEYLSGPYAPRGRLLFPAYGVAKEQMIGDIRRPLDRAMTAIGYAPGAVRPKAFRHTFCSARLQTIDSGMPVSPFTVSVEMGHGGFDMVKKVYGHLGTIRQRREHVEYRVEEYRVHYAAKLVDLERYWAEEPQRVAAWKVEVGRLSKEAKARRRLEKAS